MVNGNGHLPNPLFRGMLKPFTPRWSSPPAFLVKHICGQNASDKFYTIIQVWLHHPTAQFPTAGVFISFKNGNSSCFCKLNSPEELIEIADFLRTTFDGAKPVYTALLQEEKLIKDNLKAIESITAVKNMEVQYPDSDFSEERT